MITAKVKFVVSLFCLPMWFLMFSPVFFDVIMFKRFYDMFAKMLFFCFVAPALILCIPHYVCVVPN